MTAAELLVERISLAFGGLSVLDKVSIAVAKGEILALIGPNGAGKTTVFNCISGLYRPEGEITFRGESLLGRRPHEVARRGVARTFQHAEVAPHMSVLETVLAGRHNLMRSGPLAEMLALPSARREEAAHRETARGLLDMAGIGHLSATPVGALAFGVQKTVGFVRALAAEPALLLLDEPSAGLTQEEREVMARLIMLAKIRLGLPVIWIEHDMQMVTDLADRVHVLDYGRSLADGRPDEVLSHPDVISAYLGPEAV